MKNREDRTLVRRCITGEEEAWREFLRRYQPVLERSARFLLGQAGQAAPPEQVDEICARVYEHLLKENCRVLREFRWECTLYSWLVGMTRFVVQGILREARHETRRRQGKGELQEEAIRPPDPLEAEEQAERLRDALSTLAPEDRTALEALYLEDLSYEELSRRRRIPLGTLAARIARAKQALLTHLKGLFCL